MDADGAHTDPLDKNLSTLNTSSCETEDTSVLGIADKGTTFKSESRRHVSYVGAPCLYATNGKMFYLSSTESSIDKGTGMMTYLIEEVSKHDEYLSGMSVSCSVANNQYESCDIRCVRLERTPVRFQMTLRSPMMFTRRICLVVSLRSLRVAMVRMLPLMMAASIRILPVVLLRIVRDMGIWPLRWLRLSRLVSRRILLIILILSIAARRCAVLCSLLMLDRVCLRM